MGARTTLAALLLALGACTATPEPSPVERPQAAAAAPDPAPAPAPAALSDADLHGSWRIVALNGRAPDGGFGTGRTPGVIFSPHGYGGNTGCNSFGGLGVFDGLHYYGGPAGQTLVGCPNLEAQERAIIGLLGSGPRVTRGSDRRLTLTAPGGTMLLERNPAGPPPHPRDRWEGTPVLAGTTWVLSGIDDAWNDAAARGRVLTFDADRWSLTSPCGARTGPWRQEGQRVIAEAPAPASARPCPSEAAAVDARLLAMLDADPRFVTGPNGEILLGGGGHWAAGEGPRPRLLSDVPLGGMFSIVEVDGAPPAGEPRIDFRPSDYAGSNGCNSVQGLFLAHSGRFFSDPPMQTERACDGSLAAQERRISNLLSAGPRVAFAGNGDIFLVDPSGSLRLRRETAAGSSPPVGRLWRGEPLEVEIVRLDGKPLQARPGDPGTRLRLGAQRFDIHGGCGRLGGIWRIRAGELEFLTDAEPPPEGACALAERLPAFSRLFNGRARTLIGPSGEFILAGEGHWLTGRLTRSASKRR